jgi:hypothetical protein
MLPPRDASRPSPLCNSKGKDLKLSVCTQHFKLTKALINFLSEDGFGKARAPVKPIYFFEEADGRNKMMLGGKGAGLAEMTRLGLPVPPGFIITTEICEKFYEAGRRQPDRLIVELRKSKN